jgi:ribosome-binding factor A
MNLRLEKFSSTVKKQLAPILYEYQIHGTTVSVNSIKISPDLKVAHVFVAIFGKDRQVVFGSIVHNRGEISKKLASHIKAKFSPSLIFHLDEGQSYYERISKLLQS